METIIRVHKDYDADPFARIDKVPINDPAKSWKALGILVYVLSKPDGWEVNIKDLCNHAVDQEKAVRSGIDELVNLKYCRKIKAIDAINKRVRKWYYIFYERPYSGDLQPVQVVELDPLTQNGEVDKDPLTYFPQVEKPQVEKPQVANDPPINKVFKQLINIVTNESNNNNSRSAAAADAVVDLSKSEMQEYQLLEKRAKKLGWIGNTTELKAFYLADAEYVKAWIEKVEGVKGLRNPAGLLRKGLRSGERPSTEKEQERQALLDLGLDEDEVAAII